MDFEKLGVFYLGRSYDLAARRRQDKPLLYDSKDLVTHGVCVGMTGSGKTGLCVALLEEAAIDGIPALVIDPKGDLANLLLTFPKLSPDEFAPWINADEAQRKGVTPEEFARQQSELWKKGLAGWGQDEARIQRLRDAAEFAIYTPGSNAGLPISLLKSFAAPSPEIVEDRELLRERILATATALLSLAGIEGDPIQSREHILVSALLDAAWREGREINLAGMIQQVQSPPMQRIGVLELEAFYPARERFGLAMQLNNLLASPGFEAWMEGEALEVDRFLYTAQGRPRIAIFSIAHLGDRERMFFVSLLLNQTLSWMRRQPGTTSLRALLYMDEIFGYFPPVANPPSKQPLLTLLKQARAFGLGVLLATQNPVDLDYKGLANCGTWFIGRLQTERDKQRVLEGLEGAAASAGGGFDRQKMEQVLAGLGNRIFLMNNVHDDAPEIFETRWCLSYLRGPLTRAQIKQLMEARVAPAAPETAPKTSPAAAKPFVAGGARPVLPPQIGEHFAPARVAGEGVVYKPFLFGAAQVQFSDVKRGISETRDVTALTAITDAPIAVNWGDAAAPEFGVEELEPAPVDGAAFGPLPPAASKEASYKKWEKEFTNWVFATQALEVYHCPALKETSKPGESERDFRIALSQKMREERDRELDRLRQKYAPKIAVLQDRLYRAQQTAEREKAQAADSKMGTMFSIGTTVLGALMGRKAISATTISRAGSSLRSVSRSAKESADVGRAEETVARVSEQLASLETRLEEEAAAIGSAMDPMAVELETVAIKPKKANIHTRLVTLVWVAEEA